MICTLGSARTRTPKGVRNLYLKGYGVWATGDICAHHKSHRERSWSSGNAFDKFVAHGEMVASKTGWQNEPLGNCLSSLQYLTVSSLSVAVLIPLGSHSVKQPLLWSGGSTLRMQNRKIIWLGFFLVSLVFNSSRYIICAYFCGLHGVGWG